MYKIGEGRNRVITYVDDHTVEGFRYKSDGLLYVYLVSTRHIVPEQLDGSE